MKIDTHVDWRQVRRWKIDEATIAKDAIVHFREPTLWEGHRTEVLASGTLNRSARGSGDHAGPDHGGTQSE